MSFNHQVKYRGCIQVAHFQPSQHQPRPGLIEANGCVKQVLSQVKQSKLVVLSVTSEQGIKCVDTTENPPKIIMRNSVYEIAHCGVDVSRPRMFTVIVGTKGDTPQFFCHVFKAESKESASRVTHAVAAACTAAFQKHKKAGGRAPAAKSSGQRAAPRAASGGGGGKANSEKLARMEKMKRMSLKRHEGGHKTVSKLTDDWFAPDMSRDAVNSKLKSARVGDFFIRESSSQVGDYAISVQTGKNIWTGLVIHSNDGFQLGNKGNTLFNELTDLVSYHIDNQFMQDDFGYQMTLKLPAKNEQERGNVNASTGGMSSRTPTSPGRSPNAPPIQWPDDSDDEVDASLTEDGLTEAERFERFMDSVHVTGDDGAMPDMSELDDALDQLNEVQAEVEDDDFDPRGGAAPAGPTINSMAQAIYDALPKDDEGLLGGADARSVLTTSGLEMADLGNIWMEVDQDRRGKIDKEQLGLILGMISQKQAGEEPSLDSLEPDTISCPSIPGY